MAIKNPKSYMLVFMQDQGPRRYRPGMVVDVRDISVPLGKKECMPMFGVIYSDASVNDLYHLVEEDADEYLDVNGEINTIIVEKRKIQLDVTNKLISNIAIDGKTDLNYNAISGISNTVKVVK